MNNKPKAIILDLDGTICDTSWRKHFVSGPLKNFPAFNAGMRYDPVNLKTMAMLLPYHSESCTYLFVTGRPEKLRRSTTKWIDKNLWMDICGGSWLFLRPEGDNRQDDELKKDIYETHIKDNYEVILAVDDRPRVLRMWQSLGIPTLDAGDGVEF